MNDSEIDELLAGRALNALSPDDERRLEHALAADPALRDRVARDDETAALLAEATPEVAPPPHIRSALLARIAEGSVPADETHAASAADDSEVPGASSTTDEPTSRRPRISRGWFALAASVAVVGAIGLGALTVTQLLDRPDAVVALDRIEDADDARTAEGALADGGSLEMHWSHTVGEVVVMVDDVPELDDGRQYELWFVRDDAPVSAGVFDGGADDPTLLEGELADGDVIAVTVEQAGGSPTGQPTTEPIAAIPTE